MDEVALPTSQPFQPRRPCSGGARHSGSRNSSLLISPDTSKQCSPPVLKRQKCPWSGRDVSRRLARGRQLFPAVDCLVVLLLLIARLGLGSSLDGRPEWVPLLPEEQGGDKILAGLFESGEVLQMYHLQATAQLYEQGGLNHDLSFTLTAVAFSSLERPDVKVSMTYHPTNMTISLLPAISEDGRELHWEHQAASASYTKDLDQTYWTGTAYMGETTGAFFSYAVEFSLSYHRKNPRYQPFSVYDDYPGHEFLVASSCDEFVWALLAKAQELGVRLVPSLMPKKHKIIIYSQRDPELITLDGGGGGGDDSPAVDEDGDDDDNNGGDFSDSRTPSSWRSSSSVSNADDGSGSDRRLRSGLEQPWRRSLTTTASGATVSSTTEENGDVLVGVTPAPAAATAVPASSGGEGDDSGNANGDKSESDGSGAEQRSTQAVVEAIDSTLEGSSNGGGLAMAASVEGEGEGEGGLETLKPTVSPVASDETSGEAEQQPLDDWQQVVAYYQSLQLCLQERQFSFVQSLEDFAESFDCLDDVAFISIGPREYYKVNLTSSKVDHVSLAEDLPEVQPIGNGFALVDCLLVIWIVMILTCGVHGMLWQGGVMQHWMKTSGYAQADGANPEDVLPDRPPSLTHQMSSMYLRLSKRFLSKSEAPAGVSDGVVGVASAGEGFEAAAMAESGEGDVTGSQFGGGSSSTKMGCDSGTVKGADSAGVRANGRRNKRGEDRDRFDQDSLDVEVESGVADFGWSRQSWGRQQRPGRHHRGALADETGAVARAESGGAGAGFDAEFEGVEMSSAAAWWRARAGDKDVGVDALEGAGKGSDARGLQGRRHRYSPPPREWSDTAVAWGTNYNDGGRDLWIRFPDSPPQSQSKPVEGVPASREDEIDGGEGFRQGEEREEGHRDRGPRIEPVSSLTAKDYARSEAADGYGVSSSSEGAIGNSSQEDGIGGAAVEEEKLD